MKPANFTTFLIVTFIFVLILTGFNVYHNLTTTTISSDLQQEVKPINGTFDTTTISAITSRLNVTPIYTLSESGTNPNLQPTAGLGNSTITSTPSASTAASHATPTVAVPTATVTPGGTP